MEKKITRVRFLMSILIALSLSSFPLFAQVPKLNSYELAVPTIFLDFDGHEVTGTPWNWNGPIRAEAATLLAYEIEEIFQRVAEDFRIFNINVTTDSVSYLNAPSHRRMRVVITPTSNWYEPQAGGVAFVGSFNWGDGTPVFVFSDMLYNQPKYIAEIISHETGHSLGLQHQSAYNGDCTLSKEYAEGEGSGEISWAPIMGLSYYRNVTTWNNGPSTVACHIWQNDIQVIAGDINYNIGFREDDHGASPESSTPIIIKGIRFSSNGMINTAGDRDVFRLIVPVSSPVTINIDPMHVGAANAGANVDLKMTLLNAQAETLAINNPELSLSTHIDTILPAGTYFLRVEGTSNVNLPEFGSLGFYSIEGTMGTILPVQKLILKGKKTDQQHLLSWDIETDEKITAISIEASTDGNNFSMLTIIQPGSRSYTIRQPRQSSYYRIRLQTGEEKNISYSNVIFLREGPANTLIIQNKIVVNTLIIETASDGLYEIIDAKGQITSRGRFHSGNNIISTTQVPKGLFFFRTHANNQVQSYKLIKM